MATTMVDYYALPHSWPARAEAPNQASTVLRAEYVEKALAEDIAAELTPRFDSRRFLPYVIMHEFEGQLFSDPARFAEAVGKSELVQAFSSIRAQFQSPEDINDSNDTAPSRRILKIFPGYEKPLSGTLAVIAIGLDGIRDQCPHFNDWLNRLEALPAVPG